jgi:outer membrane protein OmpA-like peptidoglycan-associated protein
MHRRLAVSIFVGMLLISGCSTKKWVRQQTDPINEKVTQLDTQTKENAERIDAVDRRATQGITDAKEANSAAGKAAAAAQAADARAGQAQTAATTAQNAATGAQQTANTANQGVQVANTRIAAVDTRVSAVIQDQFTPAGSQTIQFKVNSSKLEPEAIQALDTIANQVTALRVGYVVEIQGFASADGGVEYNLALSQQRAEAAQRYLVSKNVPLFRISMLGLGVDNPVGDNKTRQGREQNRRVEVRVMRAVAN